MHSHVFRSSQLGAIQTRFVGLHGDGGHSKCFIFCSGRSLKNDATDGDGDAMAQSDLSSDAESVDDDSQSSAAFLKVGNGNDAEPLGEMFPDPNELARRNVLESSSDDDDGDDDGGGDADGDDQDVPKKKDRKSKNGTDVKKEEGDEDVNASKPESGNGDSPRKRKWADDPSFMKVRLSEDSDSEVEKEKARFVPKPNLSPRSRSKPLLLKK